MVDIVLDNKVVIFGNGDLAHEFYEEVPPKKKSIGGNAVTFFEKSQQLYSGSKTHRLASESVDLSYPGVGS